MSIGHSVRFHSTPFVFLTDTFTGEVLCSVFITTQDLVKVYLPRISYGFFLFSAADLLSTPQLLTFMQGREGWRIPMKAPNRILWSFISVDLLSLTHFPIEPLPHFLPSVQVAPIRLAQLRLAFRSGWPYTGWPLVRLALYRLAPLRLATLRLAPLRLAQGMVAPLRLARQFGPSQVGPVQVGIYRLARLSVAFCRLAPLRLA